MPLQVLVVDEETKRRIDEVISFASRPENVYRPGPGVAPPGDDPRYRVQMGTYLVVFSLTQVDLILFKHLSISVPERGHYPLPEVVAEVIKLFGFKGKPAECAVHVDEEDNCIAIVQAHQPILS